MKSYNLNFSAATKPMEHAWELCVGSCHAPTALREDYRCQLKQASHDCGFRYVRFHGLFGDGMSVLTRANQMMSREHGADEYILSFTNIDSIFDFLLSIGMRPFVELSFMPELLTSGPTTMFHYKARTSPPDDYGKWQWLVEQFVAHCIKRYGLGEVRQWFFEVWNEPNLGGPRSPVGFFGGTKEEYFELYAAAANGVKAIDHMLRVGGPATADNAWVADLVAYCRKSNVPLDFITTHNYPTDLLSGSKHGGPSIWSITQRKDLSSEQRAQLVTDYMTKKNTIWSRIPRGLLTEWAKESVAEADGLPVYYTEWHSHADIASDGPFGASFIAKTCMDNNGIVQGYSYWTFSDIFEEGGMPHTPYHGGFGLLTLQGVPKASYRAFQLLHKLGDEIYETYTDDTVDVYAVKHTPAGALQLLIVNHQSLQQEIKSEEIMLAVGNLPSCVSATVERVDDVHSNSLAKWFEMGQPDYPDENIVLQLKAASCLRTEPVDFIFAGGTASVNLTVPEQGIALVTLYL